ncbi:MAG: tryptophan synthase subunit alpha [Leptolyngbyaceae cyanobacterium MO_188.B28]|nr:tryptophan synthase subunit alpha [Leptolyngbyaceae cyanobacterium MO_188.B28]
MLSTSSISTPLEQRIIELRQHKEILLMSHAVLGYPSFTENRSAVRTLVEAGVELIELQFPFSEPIADGPILTQANQAAVDCGATIHACFEFAGEMVKTYPKTLFIITTYFNILLKQGVERFIEAVADAGIVGLIAPDLPPEEASEYIEVCRRFHIAAIFLVTPQNREPRLRQVAQAASGMVYCVARKGVTGTQTLFSDTFEPYLHRLRAATHLPIGVGFGVQSQQDIDYLTGKADIAIVCTQAIKVQIEQGLEPLSRFIKGLRPISDAP